MTRSVYIVGGAGSGKSTFTAEVLDEVASFTGPLVDLWSKRNAKALVTLRGHEVIPYEGEHGLYLGVLRESFPGTDGLDRASSLTGAEWLFSADLPSFILAEGATLATKRFLGALAAATDLLLVHLWAPDDVKVARFAERGSDQAETFWRGTATRAANRTAEAREAGVPVLELDSSNPDAWEVGMDLVKAHLLHHN